MKVIVDRIEGNFAVCEQKNRQILNIPLKDIPFVPREGDTIIINGNSYKLDVEETQKRKKKIKDMTDGLWE